MSLYMPPHFRVDDPDALFAFVERNAFATLVCAGDNGLHASHIPFLAERDAAGKVTLLGHVAVGNEQWKALEGARDVLAIFHGPHAYVSPGWYQNHPAVPTWNYAVVHARGKVRLLDEAELHDLLLRLSSTYEAPRERPWRMAELPADFVATMLKAIVGFAIDVDSLEGKFKLSQNRPAEVPNVVRELEREAPDVAALMRAHPPPAKA